MVIQKFADIFPDLGVEFDSVSLQESKGVLLRGVRFSSKNASGDRHPLLEAEEVFIEIPINAQSFLNGESVPQKMLLKKPKIRLTILADGTFQSFDAFRPAHNQQPQKIPLHFQDAEVVYHDLRSPDDSAIVLPGGDFQVFPPCYVIADDQEPSPFWVLSGSMSNSIFHYFELNGIFDDKTMEFLLHGTVGQLRWSREFSRFVRIQGPLSDSIHSFQAKCDCRFTLGRNIAKPTSAPGGLFFELDGHLYDGRIELPVVAKKPITDISTRFRVTQDSFHAENIQATSGGTTLHADWHQNGLFPIRAASLQSQVRDLAYSNEFIESLSDYLPPKLIDFLEDFQYDGYADLNSVLTFDGVKWSVGHVDCRFHELNITFSKFPYSVDHLTGRITISPEERLVLDLKTNREKRNIKIVGGVDQINTQPRGTVEIIADSIPIDTKLVKSLQHELAKKTIVSLNPTGEFSSYFKLTIPGDGLPLDPYLQVNLENCAIRYENFPLPLNQIQGVLEMKDDVWRFYNMTGRNGKASLSGGGYLAPMGDEHEFRLNLVVNELEMGPNLTDAILNKNQQELILSLNLKGVANLSMLDIVYNTAMAHPKVSFDASFPYPEQTSIKPAHFPYRLENLRAEAQYRDGVILVKNFSGQNDETRISGAINGRFHPDGSWQLSLNHLLAEQLLHNRNLLTAIPQELRDVTTQLNIQEPVSLQGEMLFKKSSALNAPLIAAWNVGMIFMQNSATLGDIPVTNICGKIHMLGRSDGVRNLIFGEMELDACNYRDMMFTEIHGPFCFQNQHLTLGRYALIPQSCTQGRLSLDQFAHKEFSQLEQEYAIQQVSFAQFRPDLTQVPPPGYASTIAGDREAFAPVRPIRASLYDGILLTSGNVFVSPKITYGIETQVEQIDLATASAHTLSASKGTGKLSGYALITGEGKSRDTIKGQGELQLREANLYQFPVMQEIIKYLRLNPEKEQNGITSCNVAFQILGNKAALDPIKLDGTLLSFTGEGEMRIDTSDISMVLGVRLGNSQSQIPLVSDVIGGAGDKILRLRVEGPINGKLSIKRDTLLNVGSALREQSEPKKRPVMNFLSHPFSFSSSKKPDDPNY